MSSYCAETMRLLQWLNKATFAAVTKNKVRKELLEELGQICTLNFDDGSQYIFDNDKRVFFLINNSILSVFRNFLQIDGKAENISNDALLNFNKTLDSLTKSVQTHYTTVLKTRVLAKDSNINQYINTYSQVALGIQPNNQPVLQSVSASQTPNQLSPEQKDSEQIKFNQDE